MVQEVKVAFAKRSKEAIGPFIFQERLAHFFNGCPELDVVRASRYHNIHFITIQGSGRRADQYHAKKILRVDGIYHDTTRDCESDNNGIKGTYHSADGIIFQCNFARDMLYKHFGPPQVATHETVICNGVDSSFSPEGESMEYGFDETIICSAKWYPHKRLGDIIATFLELKSRGRDVGLVVLGDTQGLHYEHSDIKYFNVPHNELPKYYRGADAMLHFAYTDWCPNTVVEAIACGVSIITTHNGGVPEMVQENGIVIKSDPDYDMEFIDFGNLPKVDESLAADAVELVLNNKMRHSVSRPDLTIKSCGQQYINFFKEVLR